MYKLKEVTDREFIKCDLPLSSNGNIIWKDTVNKNFSIRYDGIIYNFTIRKYDKEKRIVYFTDNKQEYHMYTSGLIKCNIGFITGMLTTKFKYSVGDFVNGYKILDNKRIKKKNGKTYRAYKVECVKDKYVTTVAESGLDRGDGCPVCDNKVIMRGINDMWTTSPELAKLLANPDDGYKYSKCSQKSVNWKCPYCHSLIKNKKIDVVARNNHIQCQYCGDGFSYPEKVMSNILDFFNINYIQHYRIDNQTFIFQDKNYRPEYDFYFELNDKKYIIEMDGGFHDKVHPKSNLSIEQTKEIDNKKDKLAKKNNITMTRIDCKVSDYDYIFSSIQNSILKNLFDLSKISRQDINKKAYSSNIVDTCHLYMTKSKNLNTISKTLKIPYGTVYKYLQKGAEIGLCNYDPQFSLKNKGNLDFVGTYEFII